VRLYQPIRDCISTTIQCNFNPLCLDLLQNSANLCLDLCRILAVLCLDLCKNLVILCLDLCKILAVLRLDLCKICPPRIHRPNGNMQSVMLLIGKNALFYIFSLRKTHYFTYFRLSKRTILHIFAPQKRTILQQSPYFTSYLNVYKLSRWLLMVPGNSWRVPKSTTVTLNFTGAVRATSCE